MANERSSESLSAYDKVIKATADSLGMDWHLIAAVVYHESRFHNEAQSARGAVGLMQILSSRYSQEYLLEPANNLRVGSRYLTGVNVVNWPMGRMLMSYFASAYVRLITGMQVRDATAGFVCYRREVLQSINLDAIEFKGYAFQIEMKFTAHRMGFIIKEVPIVFINRVLGTSKMNSSIFFEALWGVIKLRLDSLFNKKRFTRVPLPKQLTQ